MIEQLKQALMQKISMKQSVFMAQLVRKYSRNFFMETKKDVVDDGNPFDQSGQLVDTGELYEEADYSDFLHFLENAYNGEKSPTFMSGHGFFYDTYDKSVAEDIVNWLYEQLDEVGRYFIANGALPISNPDEFFDFLEEYDREEELNYAISDHEHDFMEKLAEVKMETVIKVGYATLSRQERHYYAQLREANQWLQKLKLLANDKKITVSARNETASFHITAQGDVRGRLRVNNNTYQKQLIQLLMEEPVGVIVRQTTNMEMAEHPVEVVYGFQKVKGQFVSLSKEMVERAFPNRLANELFKELKF